jgi:hypothetical protein
MQQTLRSSSAQTGLGRRHVTPCCALPKVQARPVASLTRWVFRQFDTNILSQPRQCKRPRHGYLSIQTDYSNRQRACLRQRSDPTTLLPAGLLLAPFRARLQHACPLPAGVQLQLQFPGVPCTLSTTLLSTHLSHTRTWFSVSEQHDASSGPLALIT